MRQKRNRFFFIPVLLLFAAVASCKPIQSTQNKATGDSLIISDNQKFAVINPLLTATTSSTRLVEIIFDGLVELDDRFEVKPRLAESWERSADGRTWTIHLRRGVKFHDGAELTADDVVFTLEKMKEFSSTTPLFFNSQGVETVRADNKYTVQIRLKEPIASFLQYLDMAILPKHLLEGKDLASADFNFKPVGTGPYRVKSWSEREIILEANESYFLGRPYLEKVVLIAYPNREAAWAKLMAGEVDFFDFLTPDNYDLSKQVPAFHFYSAPMPFYYLIAFNVSDPFFGDPNVRRALNYAVNKDEIVAKVLKGQGQAAAGTVFPGSWAYNPNVKPYPYDPRKALALLAEAGWKDHDGDHFLDKNGRVFEFTVHVNAGDDVKQKALLLIQQQLLDIGIKMRVKLFNADNIDFLYQKKFQADLPEINARGDPDLNYSFWHSSQVQSGFNFSSYHNEAVDRLLEQGRSEFDREKRKVVYYKFQEELFEDPPGIFLFWTRYLVAIHQRFKGVNISPTLSFANMKEWYVPKAEQRPERSAARSSQPKNE